MNATPKPEKTITATFSPAFMGVMIKLWRNTIDMKVPSHDDFKIHFIENRRTILQNFRSTSTAWSMLLDAMKTGTTADEEALQEARATAREFADWTEAEIAKLDEVALQESIQAGLDELVAADPGLAKRIQEQFAKFPKRPGDPDPKR